MSATLLTVLAGGLFLGTEDKPTTLRYLKPSGTRFVLESEVTVTPGAEGTTYVSRTERGTETMTLTIRSDPRGRVLQAELVHAKGGDKKTAALKFGSKTVQFQRGGLTDSVKAPADPIVTTAPDWSDVFQLVRRYDARKGGKQEFPGLWFHPTEPLKTPTFRVERLGADTVTVKDKEVKLDRYQVQLRSGPYLAWATPDGRVCKISPPGARAVPVVLEGFEEATRNLK